MEKAEAQEEKEHPNQNWSEAVEDLVAAGDTGAAISLLETLVARLETLTPSETVDLQLASARTELAALHSSRHFSLKADHLISCASLVKQRAHLQSTASGELSTEKVFRSNGGSIPSACFPDGSSTNEHFREFSVDVASPRNGTFEDDWEAIADCSPNELLLSQCLPCASNMSSTDTKVQTTKRRGRGRFSYKKLELCSDRKSDEPFLYNVEDDDSCKNKQITEPIKSKYGTCHVLVLADFPPSTRTIDLEKLFKDFSDRGVVIRWVNDTTALAVFRTPSTALEACNRIQFPFTLRILDENDVIIDSISARDLEPPRQRPQTSARTAQRLIAQGMGLKLPAPSFGSRELKIQEEARKNRIVTRQKMKDDAWGGDDK